MRNPPGCVTRCRLHNRAPSCATGRSDVLPESLPILLLNRIDSPTQTQGWRNRSGRPGSCRTKGKQKPTIQIFLLLNTLTVLINNESTTDDTTYYLCKTIALLE